MYKAAPDGGMGAFIALTTSADSFTAEAALGRAGRTAISRPTFSSAWPPGPASHPGPVTGGRATPADVAGGRAAPVTLAMRRAPPKIAAALRVVRCLLKVLFLCSVTKKRGCPQAGPGGSRRCPVRAPTGQVDVYVTSVTDEYYILATVLTSHLGQPSTWAAGTRLAQRGIPCSGPRPGT